MIQKYYALFSKAQLCHGIDLETFEKALLTLEPTIKFFKKGEIFFSENEPKKYFCMILEGEVLQTRLQQSGERAIYSYFKAGQLIGEILLFLKNRDTLPFDMIAKTDCKIMFFKNEKFFEEDFLKSDLAGRIFLNLLFDVCERFEDSQLLLKSLKGKTIRQRLANFLFEKYLKEKCLQFYVGLNRNELAELLNLPRPSLSRELSAMKNEGMIDYFKDNFKITDIEKLKENL